MSKRGFTRALRRAGRILWPREAAGLVSHASRRSLPVLLLLFLYADSSQACVSVAPGSVASVPSGRWIEAVAEDRAATVVHASVRRPERSVPMDAGRWASAPRPSPAVEPPALAVEPVASDIVEALGAPPKPATVAPAREPSAPPPAPSTSPAPAPAALSPGQHIILQGVFAVRLVESLRLRAPRGGWSPQAATSLLSTLRLRPGEAAGVLPAGGWRLGAPLTEADLASLLGYLGLQVVSRAPERPITVAEAEAILARLAALFRPLAPAAYTQAAAPAGLTLGNPRAPLSPFTP